LGQSNGVPFRERWTKLPNISMPRPICVFSYVFSPPLVFLSPFPPSLLYCLPCLCLPTSLRTYSTKLLLAVSLVFASPCNCRLCSQSFPFSAFASTFSRSLIDGTREGFDQPPILSQFLISTLNTASLPEVSYSNHFLFFRFDRAAHKRLQLP